MAATKSKPKAEPKPKSSVDLLIEELEGMENQDERLAAITKVLGSEYVLWKDHEGFKNKLKDVFFDDLDEYVIEKVEREQETKEITLRRGETIEEALVKRFPDMEVVLDGDDEPLLAEDPENPGSWVAVLQLAAKYIPYSFVNKDEQKVYARGITPGKEVLDAEAYLDYVPTLAKGVTVRLVGTDEKPSSKKFKTVLAEVEAGLRSIIRRSVSFDLALDADTEGLTFEDMISSGLGNASYSLDEEKVPALTVRYPELRAALAEFSVVGKPVVKLNAPRKAKKDEL